MTAVAITALVVALLSVGMALGQAIRGGKAAEDAERARTSAALAHIALVSLVQRLEDIGVLRGERGHLTAYLSAARELLGPVRWFELTGERDDER